MSIEVVGRWDLSWNTPLLEAPQWNLVLRDFGVAEWHMSPVTGIQNSEWREVNLHEHAEYGDALAATTGTRVFLEPDLGQDAQPRSSLVDLVHPEDVVYVFGSAHYDPVDPHWREGDLVVQLPTTNNAGVLWPHQVLVTVLYDRLIKGV